MNHPTHWPNAPHWRLVNCNGHAVGLPAWVPTTMKPGTVVVFAERNGSMRAYIAPLASPRGILTEANQDRRSVWGA